MNPGIDVVAAFNPIGEVKPVYVRLEDENHILRTYKIENINNQKAEKFSGLNAIFFLCSIQSNSQISEIKLRFYCDSHKWVLIK